jgi:hypothetical protein
MKGLKMMNTDMLIEKYLKGSEITKVVWGDLDRPQVKKGIKGFFDKLEDRFLVYRSGKNGQLLYNANVVKDELKNLGFNDEDIYDVRDIITKSVRAILDRYITNGTISEKDVYIDKDSFGVYKLSISSDTIKKDKAKMDRRSYNERVFNENYWGKFREKFWGEVRKLAELKLNKRFG